MRVSPDHIDSLEPDEVFVFGSNRIGRHGKGAARDALKWGAKPGQGEGLMGQTYGIPTKGHDMRKALTVDQIREHVDRFVKVAESRPDLHFLVTEIGCGLAWHSPKDIAPLFAKCLDLENVSLPRRFHRHLSSH